MLSPQLGLLVVLARSARSAQHRSYSFRRLAVITLALVRVMPQNTALPANDRAAEIVVKDRRQGGRPADELAIGIIVRAPGPAHASVHSAQPVCQARGSARELRVVLLLPARGHRPARGDVLRDLQGLVGQYLYLHILFVCKC